MKNLICLILVTSGILSDHFKNECNADIGTSESILIAKKTDTAQAWIVQITPAPGANSYATREFSFATTKGPQLIKTNATSSDLIVIEPRTIPTISPQSYCDQCLSPQPRLIRQRPAKQQYSMARNRFPSLLDYAYGNRYSTPALYMYGDLIRSDWYGSPYRGNYFYNQGYRPSFQFGSLQFRGYGNYDRMYNPRIIPFGFQYTGSRTYYTDLALTSMFPTYPW